MEDDDKRWCGAAVICVRSGLFQLGGCSAKRNCF